MEARVCLKLELRLFLVLFLAACFQQAGLTSSEALKNHQKYETPRREQAEILDHSNQVLGHGLPLLALFLCAVFATALFTAANALKVKRAAHNVVAHARQIGNSAATD